MNEARTRNHFPTVRSILNAEALAETVRAHYALDVTNCELLKPGLSDLYRVDTAQGPYILRVYPHGLNLGKWIEAELRILRGLRERGVAVALPIPRADGDDSLGAEAAIPSAGAEDTANRDLLPLQAPEGERNAVLFEYAHGRSLKRSRNPEDAFLFGKMAARMHLEAGPLPETLARVPLDAYTLLVRPLDLLGAAYPERPADIDELRQAAESAAQHIDALRRHSQAWGFCHGSLNFSKVHVDTRGQFTLFDFEYCGPGWPVYDVATVLNYESRETARPFLEGYQSERPLLDAERQALPWFQIANKLWMLGAAASLTCVFGSQIVTGAALDQALESIREMVEGLEG